MTVKAGLCGRRGRAENLPMGGEMGRAHRAPGVFKMFFSMRLEIWEVFDSSALQKNIITTEKLIHLRVADS